MIQSDRFLRALLNVRDYFRKPGIPVYYFGNFTRGSAGLKVHERTMENYWQQSLPPAFPTNLGVDSDALSVRVYSDEDLVSVEEGSTYGFYATNSG